MSGLSRLTGIEVESSKLSRPTGEEIESSEEFPFPFQPYKIQTQFMKSLYEAIEDKKIGIFESPTGTGKSLSIICGSLAWLRHHEKQIKNVEESKFNLSTTSDQKSHTLANSACSTIEPSWVNDFAQKQVANAELEKAKALKNLQEKRERQRQSARSLLLTCQTKKEKHMKRKRKETKDETLLLMEQAKKELEGNENEPHGDDEDFVLEAYTSDEEIEINEDDSETDENPTTKVFFCSRTHSQLSQFIQELRKSPFGKQNTDGDIGQVSVAALASRKTLCINDSVRKLPSVHQINEKCLDMQKKVKKKDSPCTSEPKRRKRSATSCTCPYFRNDDGMTLLTNKIVGSIMDMEDLVKEGKEAEACPYYATRHSLPYSQLVVLPYQTLLHESTRIASGIDIRDSVIIIDEAHNLVEAINSMYSCQVTAKQINKGSNQLNQYVQKFNKRLKAKNLYYVKQLLYVLRSLLTVFVDERPAKPGEISEKNPSSTFLMKLSEFLFKSKLDNINLFKLLKYCKKSKISLKLNGFIEKYEANGEQPLKPKSALANFLTELQTPESRQCSTNRDNVNDVIMRSPLMHIEVFLTSLTSSSEDCRIAITKGKVPTLKFLLLSPAQHFKKILDECRALIVAGGTMQPTSCFIDQLIPRSDAQNYTSRIVEFSCDHVIDGATQLLPLVLESGPSNKQFEFTFEKRRDVVLLLELGRTILNMINIIPGGVVCFFPSYDYENYVYETWKKEGIIGKLDSKKKVFREPRTASHVDKVLNEYSTCVSRTKTATGKLNGAILLSVVNGKMSEGINFSDDLGRCVVMVGLPYPNLHSPELKEKMAYLNQHLPKSADGRAAGQIHYENLCMKAVNQSIGRAIRHRNDYACLLFADVRYARPGVASKLPNWIGKHLAKTAHFGEAFSLVRKFFYEKKMV